MILLERLRILRDETQDLNRHPRSTRHLETEVMSFLLKIRSWYLTVHAVVSCTSLLENGTNIVLRGLCPGIALSQAIHGIRILEGTSP
jgi:hypothetical protein